MKKLLVVGSLSLMLALTGCGVQNSTPAPQPVSQNDGKGQPGPLGPDGQPLDCGFGEELEQELDGTWECDDDDHKKKKSTPKVTTAPKIAPKIAPKPAAPKPAAPKPAAPKSSTKK